MSKTLIPADPVKALRAGLLAGHVAAAKAEAIAQADAELNNAGLPTYSDLLAALKELEDCYAMYCIVGRFNETPVCVARALLARAGGAA
jgi:hypothetical protein